MSSIILRIPPGTNDTPSIGECQEQSSKNRVRQRITFGVDPFRVNDVRDLQGDPALSFHGERVVREAAAVAEEGRVSHHGGVVAGEDEGDQTQVHSPLRGPGRKLAAQQPVGGHAPGNRQEPHRLGPVEAFQAVEQPCGGSPRLKSSGPSERSSFSIARRAWLLRPE
jgi:hypothetical protein